MAKSREQCRPSFPGAQPSVVTASLLETDYCSSLFTAPYRRSCNPQQIGSTFPHSRSKMTDYNMADAYTEKELLLKHPLRIGLVQNYPFKARWISISAIHKKELLMGSVLSGD